MIGEHGRGGLGRVTRAHDRNLGRDVAIKELIASSELAQLRFQREALITARLEHPGIVPLYEAGTWPDGTPFYAMKLVAGRPLRDLIAERTTVEARLGLLHHVIAVADALAYAHGRKIIHRDLKPANVIVGDFGETVVIDWGLAKDLGTPDDILGATPSPSPGPSDDLALTSAGTVLGTPAYMAPEQARGEPVDARADVFAIGAMLWELCALAKVPPSDRGVRHRLLRKNRIDRDLITIIDKALATDRDTRYADAGALAADLKAFKAGARIASRDYSLLGTLAHWARRHRAFAFAIAAAVVIFVVSTSLYLRSVTAARGRSDALNNDLLLSNAESLMQRDPTAAAAMLRRYTGPDGQRLAMLEAQAKLHGAAIFEIHPYSGVAYFAEGIDQAAILSFGDDHRIIKTWISGVVETLAANVSTPHASYSSRRRAVAYACDQRSVCVLDIDTRRALTTIAVPSPTAPDTEVVTVLLSPGGTSLSVETADGFVRSWSIASPASPRLRFESRIGPVDWMVHADADTLVVAALDGIRIIQLHDGAPATLRRPAALPPTAMMTAVPIGHQDVAQIEIGTSTGDLLLVDSHTGDVTARTKVCADQATPRAALALGHRPGVVYACDNGQLGLWLPHDDTVTVLGTMAFQITRLTESGDGCCVYAGATSGELITYNFKTERLVVYTGQPGRTTILRAPSPDFLYLLTGDHLGYLYLRQPPPTLNRALFQGRSTTTRVYSHEADHSVIFNGAFSGRYHDRTLQLLQPHTAAHTYASLDPTSSRVIFYFGDGDIELWSFDPTPTRQLLHYRDKVLQADFVANGTALVVGAYDGNALTKTLLDSKTDTYAGTLDSEMVGTRHCEGTNSLVIFTARTDWIVEPRGLRRLSSNSSFRQAGICSPDGHWLVLGMTDGTVQFKSTVSGWAFVTYRGDEPVRWFASAPDSRQIAITAKDRVIFRDMPEVWLDQGDRTRRADATDHEVHVAHARYVTYSPDGEWLAVMCDNGDVWFDRRRDQHWIYRSTGTANITGGTFSPDSTELITADASGTVLAFDMTADAFRE